MFLHVRKMPEKMDDPLYTCRPIYLGSGQWLLGYHIYRVSQKKVHPNTALNFRSLLIDYANFVNMYGMPNSIAFQNCNNHVNRRRNKK